MQFIASELENIINLNLPALTTTAESKMSYKASPGKWRKKEILGHMVDSAQNNIRRFIVAGYEENPKIVYDQDKWVAIVKYQQ